MDTVTHDTNVTVTPVACSCCGDYGWVTCDEDCYTGAHREPPHSVDLPGDLHTHRCRHCPAGAALAGFGCGCENPWWPCPVCGLVPAVTP